MKVECDKVLLISQTLSSIDTIFIVEFYTSPFIYISPFLKHL